MNHIITSTAIAFAGFLVMLAQLYRIKRAGKQAHEELEEAMKMHDDTTRLLDLVEKQRKASVTILEFAELWHRPMSDDQRTNLLIEWHARLKEADVILNMKFDGYETLDSHDKGSGKP